MDQKAKRCYLASFNGERGAERNPTNYQRRDDASHIYKGDEYYEWWYVDASFDNGYHMVVTFHYMNGFLKPIIPTIQIMIYKPDGTQISRYALCKPDETYAGADWCDLRMGESRLKDMGDGTYDMYVMVNKVGVRLTMKSVVPGWKLGSGFNYKNEETGWVAGWVVPVPYAEAVGELYLKEQTLKVTGAAYHDHNWGNYYFYKTFAGWYWGRIHNKNYTIDYSWVMPREKDAPIFAPLLIARKDEIVLSSNDMEAVLEDMAKEEKSGKEYAQKITVTADALGVKMKLAIDNKRLVEAMQLPQSADWAQYYYRFVSDYKMDIEIDGKQDQVSGEMINEYMLL
jgi:hypothetical protein